MGLVIQAALLGVDWRWKDLKHFRKHGGQVPQIWRVWPSCSCTLDCEIASLGIGFALRGNLEQNTLKKGLETLFQR